jgi:hypothetical protein
VNIERKLQDKLLSGARKEGDRLMLADDIIGAALDGTRALTAGERAALVQSPLTMRRFRQLALDRQAWSGSHGMLRAAATSDAVMALVSDDGCWSLHFIEQDGRWQVILKLDAEAPIATRLMREHPMLRVVDGGGAIILQGRLDSDGECECAWPFASEPAEHLQQHGASFAVEPVKM